MAFFLCLLPANLQIAGCACPCSKPLLLSHCFLAAEEEASRSAQLQRASSSPFGPCKALLSALNPESPPQKSNSERNWKLSSAEPEPVRPVIIFHQVAELKAPQDRQKGSNPRSCAKTSSDTDRWPWRCSTARSACCWKERGWPRASVC